MYAKTLIFSSLGCDADILADAGVPIPNVPSSKVLTICHLGDDICIDGDLVLPPHLTYGLNAVQAADFVTRG